MEERTPEALAQETEYEEKITTESNFVSTQAEELKLESNKVINLMQGTELEIEDAQPQKVKKTKNKILKRVLLSILGVITLVLLIYLGGVWYFSSHFHMNTQINYLEVSGKNIKEVAEDEKDKINKQKSTIFLQSGRDIVGTILLNEIHVTFNGEEKLKELLKSQNPFEWPIRLFGETNRISIPIFTFDDKKLQATIDQLDIVKNANGLSPQNAYPIYIDGKVEIQPEVDGEKLDMVRFNMEVRHAVAKGMGIINLSEKQLYEKPRFNSNSPEVLAAKEVMENYCKTVITYQFGEVEEIADSATIGSWIQVDDNMNVVVSDEKVLEYLNELSNKYDTVGKERNFTTTGGSNVVVSGGNYGWKIDTSAELEEIKGIIQGSMPVTREPVYSSTTLSRDTTNDIGNTYVEISISGQYMWLYVDGSVVVSTPVVTGNVAMGWGTDRGVFETLYKKRNAVLVGEDYETPVNYWIPFDYSTGNGLHDADGWRSSYGGDIYYSGGSHGCVNTPNYAMSQIYNNLPVGTPVVIY